VISESTTQAAAAGRGWTRSRERSLLLGNLLVLALAILGAWAPLRGSGGSQALFVVARELAPLWAIFVLVHALLVVRRVQSDEYCSRCSRSSS